MSRHKPSKHFGITLAEAAARVLLSARLEAALSSPPSMLELAHELCVSERTLVDDIAPKVGY